MNWIKETVNPLTEKSAVDEPVQNVSIQSRDAHTETEVIVEDADSQKDTPVDVEHADTPVTLLVPARRSTRDRRPPAWISSREYDMSAVGTVRHVPFRQIQSTSEWQHKAEFLTTLASAPLFASLQRETASVILDVVNNNH